MSKGLISGVNVGDNNVFITHLQYVDDTLLFLPQYYNIVVNYKRLLQCFSIMTDLDINYSKSSLISWNNNNPWVNEMASELGCRVQNLPFVYLGVQIGGNHPPKKLNFWEPILQKVQDRLAMWKCKLLSSAGRAQLIRYVLNNFPVVWLKILSYLKGNYFGVLLMSIGG